mmetsp:Transcript_26928/g.43962  ORF Transcript_26928/g.43962 Transcript_26928/m.43962 type:complete len:109 (+) Transcript_26928:549-875(+)|eukprot:CAMPEP_0184332692 /NCGR_PEP_ID=MMETSP1089-20130417/1856_1 /TAXON_ID=38269 ORGANISM="Gloeochaete wittrockiana, Strain SAG46.84" /NCGR_SAMPLE_ID=MMETSP1089 /ASSEMBLY_ACC=CAM_ASM_000445 /LENGTH=108 /DNA_ID=CAMNT_0026656203 /DNA_START=550 /DNA_END=876 /DNA_ORIENTATION=+
MIKAELGKQLEWQLGKVPGGDLVYEFRETRKTVKLKTFRVGLAKQMQCRPEQSRAKPMKPCRVEWTYAELSDDKSSLRTQRLTPFSERSQEHQRVSYDQEDRTESQRG